MVAWLTWIALARVSCLDPLLTIPKISCEIAAKCRHYRSLTTAV